MNLLTKLQDSLKKTRNAFSEKLKNIFSISKKLDLKTIEKLEEILISSDIGIKTTNHLIDIISKKNNDLTYDEIKTLLKQEILLILKEPPKRTIKKPHIIMVLGVNGVGKTTTIGKLANYFKSQNKKVLIIAADTFRAAAIEQLEIWSKRASVDIVKQKTGADPSAVVFDGLESAIAKDIDIVLIDTAGRLHNKENLMQELKKIKDTIFKKTNKAPDETILILDATTGQNGLSQAQSFNEKVGISSIIITKLDGTAKGGIIINISNSLKIPVSYIGVGEKIDDLEEFNPEKFVDALL